MRSGRHGQTFSRLQMLKVAAVRLYLTEVFLSDTVTFSSFFSFNFINSLSHSWKTLVKKKEADDRVNSRERPCMLPEGTQRGSLWPSGFFANLGSSCSQCSATCVFYSERRRPRYTDPSSISCHWGSVWPYGKFSLLGNTLCSIAN